MNSTTRKAKLNSSSSVSAKGILHAYDLRQTDCRIQVLETLIQKATPLSLADVVEALRETKFDRATLYRNLMHLVEKQVVLRHHFGDNVWRFSLNAHALEAHEHTEACQESPCLPNTVHRHHPHFVCEWCHSVNCYAMAVDLQTMLGKENQADLPFIHEVVLRGICSNCR
jgi:Fe2+ or Zn2+ uptake regulation protein